MRINCGTIMPTVSGGAVLLCAAIVALASPFAQCYSVYPYAIRRSAMSAMPAAGRYPHQPPPYVSVLPRWYGKRSGTASLVAPELFDNVDNTYPSPFAPPPVRHHTYYVVLRRSYDY